MVASVYMPCDLGDVTSSDDYEEELGYLDGLVNSPEFDSKIIIGDFNGDPRSFSSSRFGKKMRKFATNNGVVIADLDHFEKDVNFMTWESGDLSKCSWLDYALVSNNIRSQVRDFHVIEDIVPSSDHWPVRLLIQLDDSQHNVKISNVRQNHLVCNWQQCQDLDLLRYQWELDRRLSDIEIPWDAILCNQPDRCCHKPLLEPYCKSIIHALHTAGQNSI